MVKNKQIQWMKHWVPTVSVRSIFICGYVFTSHRYPVLFVFGNVCVLVSCFGTKLMVVLLICSGSLEETLKHSSCIRGASLLVLNGFPEVLNSITAFPDLFKLPGQDLCPPFPRQTSLLQTQLTHLHIIFAWVVEGPGQSFTNSTCTFIILSRNLTKKQLTKVFLKQLESQKRFYSNSDNLLKVLSNLPSRSVSNLIISWFAFLIFGFWTHLRKNKSSEHFTKIFTVFWPFILN